MLYNVANFVTQTLVHLYGTIFAVGTLALAILVRINGWKTVRAHLTPFVYGILLILWGIAVLHIAYSMFPEQPYGEEVMVAQQLKHHIVRDTGIAFIVSGLIACIYEFYFHKIMDLEKIDSVLNAVYGSFLPASVWESIKETLTKRHQIRSACTVDITIEEVPSQSPWLQFKLEQRFDIFALSREAKVVNSVHELDWHVAPHGVTPRFTHVEVMETGKEAESLEIADGMTSLDGSIGNVNFSLADETLKLTKILAPPFGSDAKSISLRICRVEYRRCPGLFYLVFTELTKGAEIRLRKCPGTVLVETFTRQREEEPGWSELVPNRTKTIDSLLLPGHCLIFKLRERVAPATAPLIISLP